MDLLYTKQTRQPPLQSRPGGFVPFKKLPTFYTAGCATAGLGTVRRAS